MKIGVISSYACIYTANNYGALLQYYALQVYLKRRGCYAFWIRTLLPHSSLRIILRHLKHYRSLKLLSAYFKCHRAFFDFVSRYLNLSEQTYCGNENLKQNCPFADLYITGSDQVWGGIQPENYLCFVKDNSKKVAYAASFGRSDLTDKQWHIIPQWVRSFRAVSVREKSGVDICHKMGVEALHLLDPTLLIDAQDYPEASNSPLPKDGLFGYFLNINSLADIHIVELEKFAQNHQLSFNIASCQYSERFFDADHLIFPSPEEWLCCYKQAKYIVTNTFHGTVFALIYHKPFIVILQRGESSVQNERITSLLNMFDLKNRLWQDTDWDKTLQTTIDWEYFDTRLKKYRNRSDLFFNSLGI